MIMHGFGLISEITADTLLVYLGYFFIFYFGVCIGVYWGSEHYKFLEKCRGIMNGPNWLEREPKV